MIDWICTNAGQIYPGSISGLVAMERRLPMFPCLREINRTQTWREVENQYGQRHEISVRDDGVLLHDGKVY